MLGNQIQSTNLLNDPVGEREDISFSDFTPSVGIKSQVESSLQFMMGQRNLLQLQFLTTN